LTRHALLSLNILRRSEPELQHSIPGSSQGGPLFSANVTGLAGWSAWFKEGELSMTAADPFPIYDKPTQTQGPSSSIPVEPSSYTHTSTGPDTYASLDDTLGYTGPERQAPDATSPNPTCPSVSSDRFHCRMFDPSKDGICSAEFERHQCGTSASDLRKSVYGRHLEEDHHLPPSRPQVPRRDRRPKADDGRKRAPPRPSEEPWWVCEWAGCRCQGQGRASYKRCDGKAGGHPAHVNDPWAHILTHIVDLQCACGKQFTRQSALLKHQTRTCKLRELLLPPADHLI
jgi:hypothetical protein